MDRLLQQPICSVCCACSPGVTQGRHTALSSRGLSILARVDPHLILDTWQFDEILKVSPTRILLGFVADGTCCSIVTS